MLAESPDYIENDILKLCDICNGSGYELDEDNSVVECHLCEGAGWFDADGFPIEGNECPNQIEEN